MKRPAAILTALCILAVLAGCRPYESEDFIGLTSLQITEKYGKFDVTMTPPTPDGVYRSSACGYIVTEAKVGFLGTTPPEYFMIYFDENGVAYKCAYEIGGWGG